MAHSLLIPALAIGAGVVAVKKGWVPNPISWVKDKLSGHKESMPGQDWAHKNLMSGMYGVGQMGSPDDLAAAQQAMMADLERYQQAPQYAPAGTVWGAPVPMYQAQPYPIQAYYYGSPWAPPSPWGQQSLAPVYGPGQPVPGSLPQGGMVAEWSNVR